MFSWRIFPEWPSWGLWLTDLDFEEGRAEGRPLVHDLEEVELCILLRQFTILVERRADLLPTVKNYSAIILGRKTLSIGRIAICFFWHVTNLEKLRGPEGNWQEKHHGWNNSSEIEKFDMAYHERGQAEWKIMEEKVEGKSGPVRKRIGIIA